MSLTIRELFELKYQQLINDITDIDETLAKLLPPYEADMIITEIITVIDFFFPDDNISYHLDQLLIFKEVTTGKEQYGQLIVIIEKYLKFIKKIKSLN